MEVSYILFNFYKLEIDYINLCLYVVNCYEIFENIRKVREYYSKYKNLDKI